MTKILNVLEYSKCFRTPITFKENGDYRKQVKF